MRAWLAQILRQQLERYPDLGKGQSEPGSPEAAARNLVEFETGLLRTHLTMLEKKEKRRGCVRGA